MTDRQNVRPRHRRAHLRDVDAYDWSASMVRIHLRFSCRHRASSGLKAARPCLVKARIAALIGGQLSD
jgi:hypothetical protein